MTSRELFELASLDVLGLLDEQERAAFEEAFRAAPPHIQAQVRAEQTRFADMDRLLPEVEPPVGLRAKVFAAMKEAIASVRTEPIATINHDGRVASLGMPLWRAACIGFATASLVLAFFSWSMSQTNKNINDMALNNATLDDLVRRGGSEFGKMLTGARVQHVSFTPAAQDYSGKAEAMLVVNPDKNDAYLVCNGLPASSGKYRLMAASQAGDLQSIAEFIASPGTVFIRLENFDLQTFNKSSLRLEAPQPDGARPQTLLVSQGV